MTAKALEELVSLSKAPIQVDAEKKFIDMDTVVAILVFQGLKVLLPEIKEWIKLGLSAIVLKRMEIEKRLKDFALEKELDYRTAEKASKKIAANINEKNIKNIISELEESK